MPQGQNPTGRLPDQRKGLGQDRIQGLFFNLLEAPPGLIELEGQLLILLGAFGAFEKLLELFQLLLGGS